MSQEHNIREFSFDTADFSESVSWATQSMSNTETDKIGMSFYENELKFVYRDRTVFLESLCASASYDGEDGSLQLHGTALSRFLKVLPKTSAIVTLKEELNQNGVVTSLIAKCGNVKAKIPCTSGKAVEQPKYFTTATFSAGEFFPSFARAGASANNSKEGGNALSSVDFAIHANTDDDATSDHITIFGTDSFIMNLSEVDCTVNKDENFDERVNEKRFLIPAHFANLKAFASSAKVDETVELVVGSGKQDSIGFAFPNGSLCLFTCMNVSPIAAAKRIFENTKKAVTHKFTIDTKSLRTNVRNIISLNPETETVRATIHSDNLILSDSGQENMIKLPIEVLNIDGSKDEDFSIHNIKFSNLIVTKMFNALSDKDSEFYFSTKSNNSILMTFDPEKTGAKSKDDEKIDIPDDKKTHLIVALYK